MYHVMRFNYPLPDDQLNPPESAYKGNRNQQLAIDLVPNWIPKLQLTLTKFVLVTPLIGQTRNIGGGGSKYGLKELSSCRICHS